MDKYIKNQFIPILDDNETVLWTGTPHRGLFILSGLPLLIFGLIWGMFDLVA
jgi:hypothetical protein